MGQVRLRPILVCPFDHPKCQDKKKGKMKKGREKETRAGQSIQSAFRVSTGLHVEHRRPKASDAPHEGLLKVERQEFRCLGFRF